MMRTILGTVFLGCGVLALLMAVYGIYHFHFVMNRMHAAALVDALALSFLIAGLIVLAPDGSYIPKLVLILLIQWIGSPIASHMVARLEIRSDPHAAEHMATVDLSAPADAAAKEEAKQ